MPTYTENYNLTKPVRGAEIVDINVINGNMDTIDAIMHSTQISLAEPYDDTRTSANPYNTGDLCLQDFHVYRCDEDGVYGAWDATKWTQTTLAENTGGGTASEVSYDNTDSGMTATNVQDAVDELKEAIDDIPQTEVEVTASESGQSIAEISVNGDSTSINLPAIEGSGSGAVVTIEDALNKAISKLSFYIEPVQSGSGDPSPQNQRPISGWTEATIGRDTSNFLPPCVQGTYTDRGITATVGNNNIIHVTGQNTSGSAVNITIPLSDSVKYNGSCYAHFRNTIANTSITLVMKTDAPSLAPSNRIIGRTEQKGLASLRLYIAGSVSTALDFTFQPSLEVSNAETDYEPYSGTTYNLSWQSTAGTVYGGQLTVFEDGSGELEVDKLYVDLGDLTWEYQAGTPNRFRTAVQNIKFGMDGLCSVYPLSTLYQVDHTLYMAQDYWGSNRIAIYDSDYSSASDFKTAVTGQQFVYPIKTPQTYTFPAGTFPRIETLKGTNNIWSNTGDIEELTYQKDIVTMLNMLWDAVFNSGNGTRTLASLNLSKGASEEVKKVEENEDEKPVEKEEQR